MRKNDVRDPLLHRAPSGNRLFQRCSGAPPRRPAADRAAPERTAARAIRASAAEADNRECARRRRPRPSGLSGAAPGLRQGRIQADPAEPARIDQEQEAAVSESEGEPAVPMVAGPPSEREVRTTDAADIARLS